MQPYAMLHLLLAAIVMASSSKKALVNKVRCVVGTHGIPDSTLAAVLEKLKTHQDILDETWSRRRLSKIALEIMGRIGCVETLPYAEGDGQFQWDFAEPTRLVAVMVEECPVLQSIFEERLAVHPLSPDRQWNVILYGDEITPGNQVKAGNHRNNWLIYFNFREFGAAYLAHEEVWFPLAVLRTNIVKDIRGQVSGAFRVLMRRMFLGPNSFNRGGIVIKRPNGSVTLLFARLGNILGDEAALAAIYCGKSASGLLCCLKCRNVASVAISASRKRARQGSVIVELDCTDRKQFDARTNEDFFDMYDSFVEHKGTMLKGKFGELEKHMGFYSIRFAIPHQPINGTLPV